MVRKETKPRSSTKRWQRLTAFLTAVAIIAGFLPLGAVKVSADGDTVDCEVVVENEDNNNYTSQVAVQYMANPEADPNDDASWTDIAPNVGTSVYSFPVTAKDGDDIHVRFILSKVDGENDPRVITGFKATVGDNQIIPVVDERLSDDLCTLTVPFDTTAGVSKVAIRVSLPNNLEFNQTNEWNQNFYQFIKDRELSSLTIPSERKLEIFGANVSITGNLILEENAVLQIQDRQSDSQEISTGTLSVGSIVASGDARIVFESKANIPEGFIFYHWGESGPEEVDPSDIPDDMYWFELYYDAQESKWFFNEFDPQSFGVVVENDNFNGVTLEYTVEYRKHGDTDWIEADYGLPDGDPNKANVSGGTVTIDSMHDDLKELFFRLPDDLEAEGTYPNIDFRITVSCSDKLTLNSVTLGHSGDEGTITPDSSENNVFIFSNIDIFGEIPHDFNLSVTNTFDQEDYYGLGLIIPFDESMSLEWNDDGETKTVTIPCINGTVTVSSDSKIFLEKWIGDENNPSVIAVWSESDDYEVEAWPATACTAYLYGEGSREKINGLLNVNVTGLGLLNMSYLDLGFEKTSLNFEGFTTVSPEPPEWEDNNPDKDYTLTSDTYTVSYEGGTVTAELQGDDSTWSGYIITRWDDYDKDYHTVFQIEPSADIKLTFEPAEGYEIDPGIVEDWGLDDDNSCIFALGTEMNHFNDPFREEGGNPPDPQGTCKVVFTGATGMTDENTEDAIVVINYAHGSVTLTQGEGTMGDGDVFNPVWDSETNTITIEYNRTVEFTIDADEDYDSTCKINNVDQGYKDAYSFDAIPETTVDITFTGPSFILEVGGNLKEGTTYEVDDTNNKITLTYDHGTVEITNYISLVEVNGVTPGGSSVVISYEFTLEGNSADVTFIPDENYIFSGMHLDGKDVAPDDERIENGVLSLTGIDKNNKVSIEPRFDETPVLKIAAVENDSFTYNSLNKTLTFSEDQTDKGTVEITNESDPFSGNPQNYSEITSDITFTITPADGYVCFVMLNNGQELYFPTADTYTLKASDLRSDPVEGNENVLTFEFKKLEEDQLAKVKFDGAVDSSGDYYRVSYIDAVAGVQLGSVKISKDAIESCDEETSTFTIKQDVSSLELTITPKTGYTPKLVEYGPEYSSGENPTVTGEWTRELTLTNNNGTYSYSLAINPQNGEPVGLRVSFDNTKYIQTTVTYKDYEGEQCAIEIGGNGIPGGDLNNKLVEYETPLSLDANENSKEYVKVEGGKEYVRMQISVPFIYYMSEVKVNGEDYSAELPDTYEELVAAFGSQYTNAIIWVPVSDNYVIETKTVNAVFDEDPEKTTLAVGNFLWFYDESHKDNDDYVKNAYLEIVQVVYNGEVYTKDKIEEGSAISWDVIETDGVIVGGEATLPAGSYVTMKLIPDYGTQLVSLGLNGGGFTADQNEMYTYSFYVGPGNFHLNATFEEVENVVDTTTDAISSGSVSIGDDEINNGTAVLFVGDAAPEGDEKTSFENVAEEASVQITSYLDISLSQVVYQGVSKNEVSYSGDDKNVWSEGLNNLSNPATITLELAEEPESDAVVVLHYHDGEVEILDADYDADTNSITFDTDSFSDYAVAYLVDSYDLWVGNTRVTSGNAGNVLNEVNADGDPTVVYDADTNTLTLNGATITGPVRESASDYDADGGIIYAGEDDFTINVIGGTTTVTGSNTERGTSAGLFFGNPEDVWSYYEFYDVTIDIAEGATLNLVGGVPDTTYGYPSSCGLCNTSFGTLTITGSGTLNATGGAGNFSYGIDTNQTLIIDGPTVNASGADSYYSVGICAFNVTVDSGTLTASGGYSEEDGAESYGIDAYSSGATALVINEGAVTATGYTSALHAPATLADGVTAGGSTNIDGTGAVTYVADDNSSYKWFGTPFTINYDLWVGGIQVTSANASNVLGDTGTPTVVYDADTNTLTLNGATITGPDSEVLGWNAGGGIVYSGTEDFTIKVTGGTSTVTGGNNSDRSAGLLIADPRYVFSGSSNPCKTAIIIDEGATLTLVGGVPNTYGACSVGLLCDTNGELTITGSGTLNAAGSGASNINVSYGIYTQKKLTIDGPTVNASGAANSSVSVIVNVGIYSCGGVIINSGTVTTTAGYINDYRDWSYGIKNTNNAITINGGTLTASGYSSALSMSPTLGDGVTASGSTNMNGSDAVSYVAADNASYKWFSTTFTPLTYGISLDKTGTYTFTEATVGYSALDPVTVTVTNTGTGATGNLTVALSGTDASSFTLSKTSLSGISANGSDTFTIVPKDGLAAKTYTATVTVSGGNDISATFNVSFTVNPLYTVTFNANGHGMNPDALQVAYNGRATRPDDPVATGYTFGGWYTNSACTGEAYDFSTAVTADIMLYAKWTPVNYTVMFSANGHGTAPAALEVAYRGRATRPADPAADGFIFGGWFTDSACTKAYEFSTEITGDITLYAKWTVKTYTVTFNANGHGTAPSAQTVDHGSKAAKPADPTADQWVFGGWFTDSACTKAYDFSKGVTANITLYAKWTPSVVPSSELLIGGSAHVQDFGDRPVKVDPSTGIMTIGTRGQAKRLEEILIDFQNTTGYTGRMEYRVHVQDIGWMDWTPAGTPAGTEGLGKRLEAIEIRLTGELAKHYSVEYCAHIQDLGDAQGWVRDGALAGTTGESKRVEEIKVRIVPIGRDNTTSVNYRVHVQDYGWENKYVANGAMSGTSGQSKRLEGIEIHLSGCQYRGGIRYRTHIQNIGWESTWARDGEMSGTQGKALRLEAIQIELYGEMAEHYDIYYRVHAQDIGWMSWASNGAEAGTAARSARLEGIQIVLVPKGAAAPGKTYAGITAVDSRAFVNGF